MEFTTSRKTAGLLFWFVVEASGRFSAFLLVLNIKAHPHLLPYNTMVQHPEVLWAQRSSDSDEAKVCATLP